MVYEFDNICLKAVDWPMCKIWLYNVYIFLVLLYGADAWCMTCLHLMPRCIWPMLHMLHVPHTPDSRCSPCDQWRSKAQNQPANRQSLLRLFGHVACANPSQDHSHALWAAINHPPSEWHHRTGQPKRTWQHTVKLDVCRCNIGLHSVRQCAQVRRN